MKEGITMPVLSINRHRMKTDGVGVTTLVASYGCPLRCKYCINAGILKPEKLKLCKNMTPEELYDVLKIDDLYFQATGGGITFGGGESLIHSDFIARFREICRDKWNITLETSLNVPKENLLTVLPAVNDFIVDIKDMNPEIYEAYTGRSNDMVLENLSILIKEKSPEHIRIRVPKIPNHNGEEDLKKSVALLEKMGFTNIQVFPYVIREN